jgi:hypothetical protein
VTPEAIKFRNLCDLSHKVHRLEMRSEQLLLHLEALPTYYSEARAVALELIAMHRLLTTLKERHFRLDLALGFAAANRNRLQ